MCAAALGLQILYVLIDERTLSVKIVKWFPSLTIADSEINSDDTDPIRIT